MIPILTYHAIGNEPSPLWTSPERLDEQLSALVRLGCRGVTLSEALDALERGTSERLVVLSFDDAYVSVAREALPRLRAIGYPATVFVISGYCGETNRWPGQPSDVPVENLLSWSELAALAAEGWEIGGHTVGHRALRGVPAAGLDAEIAGCRWAIEEKIGQPCESFAYPYGEFDREARAKVQSTYRAAVGTSLGLASNLSDPFALPRIDSFYLTRRLIEQLYTRRVRIYLGGRQCLRRARRIFRKDWA